MHALASTCAGRRVAVERNRIARICDCRDVGAIASVCAPLRLTPKIDRIACGLVVRGACLKHLDDLFRVRALSSTSARMDGAVECSVLARDCVRGDAVNLDLLHASRVKAVASGDGVLLLVVEPPVREHSGNIEQIVVALTADKLPPDA